MPINKGMMTSDRGDWETPRALFEELDGIWHFDLDPCSTDENAKCSRHFTKEQDGLAQPWSGRVFVNPPYGREIGKWVEKCSRESGHCEIVVALLPARTDTRWFHDYIYAGRSDSVRFIRGRLKFELNGEPQGSAPFPSMLVTWIGTLGRHHVV